MKEAQQAFEQALALAADPEQRAQAHLGLGIACAEWAQRAEARLAVADILKTQRDVTRAHREVD